jgi:CTD small phosphatase-like protein 2
LISIQTIFEKLIFTINLYKNFQLKKEKIKIPFLPPINKKYKYTLVVDLDETLVHYVEEGEKAFVQVRPFADYFLNELGKYFEIVIFTAAAEDYADIVLKELDKNNSVSYKLYRKHTNQLNGIFLKDLSKLGRDINKVCIIDNNKENFGLQPANGLHICSFMGDQNDNELNILSKELMQIIKSNLNDIVPIIKKIQKSMNERYKKMDLNNSEYI